MEVPPVFWLPFVFKTHGFLITFSIIHKVLDYSSVSCSELFVMKQEEVMTIVEQTVLFFFISTYMSNPLLLSIFSHIISILSRNKTTKVII